MKNRRDFIGDCLKGLAAVCGWETGQQIFSSDANAETLKKSGTEYVCDMPDGCDRLYCDTYANIYTDDGNVVYWFDGEKFQELNSLSLGEQK